MPLYSLKKIGLLAASRQTYMRGVSGYNAGWVRNYAVTAQLVYTDFYPEYVTAEVAEAGTIYISAVGFDKTDAPSLVTCTCGDCDADGACKHVVAMLTYKYYKDMIDGLPTATTPPPQTASNTAVRRLIDSYLSRESIRIAAQSTAERVVLTPTLSLTGVRPTVRFAVGTARPYMLKNLMQFARCMTTGESLEYGKQLTLVHHRESFDTASLPLLDFLLGELSERSAQPPAGAIDELSLSPTGLDRFFAAAAGCAVLAQTAAGVASVRLVDGDPMLTATVERYGDGARFVAPQTVFATGLSTVYVWQDDIFYRTSPDYGRCMVEWLRAMKRASAGLTVTDGDLGVFCAGVLATVEPHLTLDGEVDILAPHRPRPMTAAVYLDAPDEMTVTARLVFDYGGEQVEGFDDPADAAPWRDVLAEARVEAAIAALFDGVQGGRLTLTGDDERLFSFVTDGVERLRRVATVYATDAFERLTVVPQTRVSVGLSLRGDLLDMTVDVGDLSPSDLDGIILGYRENKPFHRLKNGRFVRLDDGALADLATMAETLGLSRQELRTGRLTLPKYRAFTLERLLRHRAGVTLTRDDAFRGLVHLLRDAGEQDYPVPQTLCGELREYQVTGYRWLRTMEELGFGGILADDMGLGKTVQVIALLLAAKERGDTAAPSLVVCPTSVVLGWERELARFAPSLRVAVISGDAATRRALIAAAGDADVLITSYDMLKRDIEIYAPMTFRYHILDEAQYIKNSTTQNARAVKLIRSAQRFALTGTPMENRLSELWSIMDFLMQGLLFSYQKFRARFELPIMRGQDSRALMRLGQAVSPFVLRRLKSEVLTELPPKTERVLPATMDEPQRLVYSATVQELRGLLRGGGRLSGHSRMTVLALLTRLRQICCDPRLCCEGYTGASGKLETCMELLREAADSGHKVLLFSQFTSMLDLLRQRLEREGIAYYRLQGSTKQSERARLVEAFNTDKTPVFLISLKAGGTGLNLTGADMVIHYDPWWNLSVQNQATDRAYRIGQKNPVQVVRLIMRDTVEERILRLQEDKWQLAESVVGNAGVALESLSAEELLALLG